MFIVNNTMKTIHGGNSEQHKEEHMRRTKVYELRRFSGIKRPPQRYGVAID